MLDTGWVWDGPLPGSLWLELKVGVGVTVAGHLRGGGRGWVGVCV